MSIDFLRGLTIFTMILVNNPGSWSYQFSPLKHAPWHGWTVTDLVFPFFLFIVGLSISISQQNSALKQSLSLDFGKSVFIRFIKLMCLGWFLSLSYYNFYDPNFDWVEGRLYSLRWFGVLQRIAIVYLCCAFIHQYLSNILKVAICILLLFSYWTAMLLVELTDANGIVYQGNLLPGKNLAAYIDHHLFGLSHLYHKSSVPFASDPEGLLTTIPAIVSCLIGILVAEIILTKPSVTAQIKQLSLVGLSLFGLSYLLSIWIPFNKNLWTPSYVLLASGLAMLVLAASRWLIDLKTNKLPTLPSIFQKKIHC